MTPNAVVERFKKLSLGDSMIQVIELRTGEARCHIQLDTGSVLSSEHASIFESEAEFAPALLALEGVRSTSWEGGVYQLNSTVVDFGAAISDIEGYVDFYFDLTGGTDPDSFLVKLRIVAKSFAFGAG